MPETAKGAVVPHLKINREHMLKWEHRVLQQRMAQNESTVL